VMPLSNTGLNLDLEEQVSWGHTNATSFPATGICHHHTLKTTN